MNENFVRFAKVLLKEHYDEFYVVLGQSNSTGILADQLILFAESRDLMFTIDWSGESGPGEIANGVNTILDKINVTGFEWDNNAFTDNIDFSKLERGDFPPFCLQQ